MRKALGVLMKKPMNRNSTFQMFPFYGQDETQTLYDALDLAEDSTGTSKDAVVDVRNMVRDWSCCCTGPREPYVTILSGTTKAERGSKEAFCQAR